MFKAERIDALIFVTNEARSLRVEIERHEAGVFQAADSELYGEINLFVALSSL